MNVETEKREILKNFFGHILRSIREYGKKNPEESVLIEGEMRTLEKEMVSYVRKRTGENPEIPKDSKEGRGGVSIAVPLAFSTILVSIIVSVLFVVLYG